MLRIGQRIVLEEASFEGIYVREESRTLGQLQRDYEWADVADEWVSRGLAPDSKMLWVLADGEENITLLPVALAEEGAVQ